MNFIFLDITLLVLFLSFISFFLYKNRKKLKKEGILLLYHTRWGTKLIEKTGKKYEKILKPASYVSVVIGYLLMITIIWMFIKIVWVYVFQADLVRAIKMPPIMPLIPYLPQMFKLSWLPPFYFSYWIIILAIIAITHEFFHGIFAALYRVKTKTTGFGFFPRFLPIFTAAFVNLDEKIMAKKSSFKQRAVLSAGTFANILTALLGVILMFGFFSLTFSPAGIVYDDYAYEVVPFENITSINGVSISSSQEFLNFNQSEIKNIETSKRTYYTVKAIDQGNELAALYFNSPAIRENLTGAIIEIDGEKITSLNELSDKLSEYSPRRSIDLTMFDGQKYYNKEIKLDASPADDGSSWLGVTFIDRSQSGVIGKFISYFTSYKKPNIFYTPDFAAAQFIYDFLWWLVLISFSVALINMLPMGMFDGGRFFYLTILSITKSEKIAEKSYKYLTVIFLFALFVMMFFWAKNLF